MGRARDVLLGGCLALCAVAAADTEQALTHALTQSPEVFNVVAFGARGDGVTRCDAAVAAAVAACRRSASPAKRIVFPGPSSVFLLGPIDLSCNDTAIDISSGAVVRSVNTTVGWPLGPDCPEPSQGLTSRQAAPFVMLRDARYMTVSGGGTIDAAGPMWWHESCGNWWCPPWVHNATPATPYAWRPFALRIMGSSDVTVSGVTINDCGFWCVVPTHSSGVVVEGVTINTGGRGPNTDGVEPMWSSDVRVSNVSVWNGDDCVTVKSGSRNVLVENLSCKGSHGVTVGSVWYDDVVNVTYRNVTLTDCANGPRLKGRRQGNATIRGVLFENIAVVGAGNGIQIDMDYETPGTHPTNTGVTAVNISFVNVTGTATSAGDLQCLASRKCTGVTLDGVHLAHSASLGRGFAWSCGGLDKPRWVDVTPTPGPDCAAAASRAG